MSTTPDDRLVDGESADEPEKDAEATRGVGGSERAGGPSAGSDAEADLPDEARRAIDELVAEATSRQDQSLECIRYKSDATSNERGPEEELVNCPRHPALGDHAQH